MPVCDDTLLPRAIMPEWSILPYPHGTTWPDGIVGMLDFQRRAGGRSMFGSSTRTTFQKLIADWMF